MANHQDKFKLSAIVLYSIVLPPWAKDLLSEVKWYTIHDTNDLVYTFPITVYENDRPTYYRYSSKEDKVYRNTYSGPYLMDNKEIVDLLKDEYQTHHRIETIMLKSYKHIDLPDRPAKYNSQL